MHLTQNHDTCSILLQIKVYAVTRYSDERLQFINKFYFKARVRGEMPSSANNYDFVAAILSLTTLLPVGIFPLAGLVGHKLISLSISQYETTPFLGSYVVLAKAIIVLMSCLLSLLCFIFHILAMVGLYEYTGDIVLDSTTTDETNTEAEDTILAVHCLISFGSLIGAIVALIYYIHKEILTKVKALLIFNVIYLGYFLPYMIIAFIDNPIHTIFVYILLLIFTAVLPLILFLVVGLKYYYSNEDNKEATTVLSFTGLSIGYYLVCLILLFTIGGFNNFKDLRNLLWLLLGTILTAVARQVYVTMQAKRKKKAEDSAATAN